MKFDKCIICNKADNLLPLFKSKYKVHYNCAGTTTGDKLQEMIWELDKDKVQ